MFDEFWSHRADNNLRKVTDRSEIPNEIESQAPKNESVDQSVGSVDATPANNDDDDANDEPIETEDKMEIDDKTSKKDRPESFNDTDVVEKLKNMSITQVSCSFS